jgi:hypothetical protein
MLGRTSWMKRSAARLWEDGHRSWLAWFGRWRWFQGWLTRWTVWTGQADCLLVVARKPQAAAQAQAA